MWALPQPASSRAGQGPTPNLQHPTTEPHHPTPQPQHPTTKLVNFDPQTPTSDPQDKARATRIAVEKGWGLATC